MEFKLQNAWRRNGYRCYDLVSLSVTACSEADGRPGVGDIIAEFIGGSQLDPGGFSGGIGSPLGPLLYLVTSIDGDNNWLFGSALDPASFPVVDTNITHTYTSGGSFTAQLFSCCRISGSVFPNAHINNPNGWYDVETLVDIGMSDNSPVSALPPIVTCPIDALCTFFVPGADPDNDSLGFRLSSALEASGGLGFTQPGPPQASNSASVNSTSGLYSWDTTGATLGGAGFNTLYSTQVTIESLDADGTVKGKSAVDFLIQLDDSAPPPVIESPPTPVCNSTVLTVAPGELVTFIEQSSDPSGLPATINVAGLPAGALMTPALPVSGNPVNSTFNWVPTAAQSGTHVINFSHTNSDGGQALCSITIVVKAPPEEKVCDCDEDGDVDINDIQKIFADRNQPATGPSDPRDADGDGVITVNDGRACVLKCTNAQCAS